MQVFEKPAPGSWTEAFAGLGTEPLSYEDSVSPEWFEAERDAIFRRVWLNVGRVEQLGRTGSYFTKDLPVARTSLLLVRTAGGAVRAFHNMCSHRGNKLMWNDTPWAEVSGSCRQFTCKYHGWRYGLDGEVLHVPGESEFFDLDKSQWGLTEVHCDVWAGFIFVNLAPEPPETLREFLGELTALESWPFGEMTEVHAFRAVIKANWKVYVDSFSEVFHAPFLHQAAFRKADPKPAADGPPASGASGQGAYRLFGPHRVMSIARHAESPPEQFTANPLEKVFDADIIGPRQVPALDFELPEVCNFTGHPRWVDDAFGIFPNFMVEVLARGWYFTYHFWPLTVDSHLFETRLYFVPPKTTRERLAQEMTAVAFKEVAMQDANTLEATQAMLASGAKRSFPLCDQEVLLRHFHRVVADYVAKR